MVAGYQICRHSVSHIHTKPSDELVKSADMLYLSFCKSVVLRSIVKFIHQADTGVEGMGSISSIDKINFIIDWTPHQTF